MMETNKQKIVMEGTKELLYYAFNYFCCCLFFFWEAKKDVNFFKTHTKKVWEVHLEELLTDTKSHLS